MRLREAAELERQKRDDVNARREALLQERIGTHDAALCLMADLADAHARDRLAVAERELADNERAVAALRQEHLQAMVEHKAIVRLKERRDDEARVVSSRREQRMLDEFAAR